LQVEVAAVRSRDDRFQPRLLGCQCIEIGIGFGVGGIHRIELGFGFEHFTQTAFDRLAHGLLRVQLRFLRQVADIQVRHRDRFADDVRVDAGHDFKQRRFSRTVLAQHADFGAREK
jgi:hypothetical protein